MDSDSGIYGRQQYIPISYIYDQAKRCTKYFVIPTTGRTDLVWYAFNGHFRTTNIRVLSVTSRESGKSCVEGLVFVILLAAQISTFPLQHRERGRKQHAHHIYGILSYRAYYVSFYQNILKSVNR